MKKSVASLDEISTWLTTSQEEGGCGHVCLLLEIDAKKRARFIQFDVELLRVSRQDIGAFELDHKRTDIDPLKVLRSWATRIDELNLKTAEEVQAIFQRFIDKGDLAMKKKFFQAPTTSAAPQQALPIAELVPEPPAAAQDEAAAKALAPKAATTRPVVGDSSGISKEQRAQMEKVGNGALKIARKHKKAGTAESPTAAPSEGDADMAAKKSGTSKAKKSGTSKTKKPATAPKKKAAPSAATAKRSNSGFGDEAKITVLVKENPKREGSEAHRRFKLYRTGMTVADYLAKGGTGADLTWDTKHRHVSVK